MNYYELLGVSQDASQEEIRKAFRKIMRQHHPDVSTTTESARISREATEAFNILTDTTKKWDYDQTLKKSNRSSSTTSSNTTNNSRSYNMYEKFYTSTAPTPETAYTPEEPEVYNEYYYSYYDPHIPQEFYYNRDLTSSEFNYSKITQFISIFLTLTTFIIVGLQLSLFVNIIVGLTLFVVYNTCTIMGRRHALKIYRLVKFIPKQWGIPLNIKEYSYFTLGGLLLFLLLAVSFARVPVLLYSCALAYTACFSFFNSVMERTQLYKVYHPFYSRMENNNIPRKAFKKDEHILENLLSPILKIPGVFLIHKRYASYIVYGRIVIPIVSTHGSNNIYIDKYKIVVNGKTVMSLKEKKNYPFNNLYEPVVLIESHNNTVVNNGYSIVLQYSDIVEYLERTIVLNGVQNFHKTTYSTLFV